MTYIYESGEVTIRIDHANDECEAWGAVLEKIEWASGEIGITLPDSSTFQLVTAY